MRRREFLIVLGGLLAVRPLRAQERVDLNSATKAQLEALPGIGEKIAEQIIENRTYKKVDDLLQIPRFGRTRLERIRSLVTVGEAEDAGTDDNGEVSAAPARPRPAPTTSTDEWKVPAGYKVLRCWRCQEVFAVEVGTASGVCPYCGIRWAERGAKP